MTKQKWLLALLLGLTIMIGSNDAHANADATQATQLYFYDMAKEAGVIYGNIRFKPGTDISNLTDYAVYFTNATGSKIMHIFDINIAEAEASMSEHREDHYSYYIANRNIPNEATHLGVFPKTQDKIAEHGSYVAIWDSPTQMLSSESVTAIDMNPQSSKTEFTVSWTGIADESHIKGYQLKYTTRFHNVEEQYSHGFLREALDVVGGFVTKKGDGNTYEVTLPANAIPIHAYYLHVYPIHVTGEEGFAAATGLYDDISATPPKSLTPTSGLPYAFMIDSDIKDTDDRAGYFGGELRWNTNGRFDDLSTDSGGSLLRYAVYFLDKDQNKLQGLYAMDRAVEKLRIPNGTPIPKGAQSIGIFTEMATARGIQFAQVALMDVSLHGYFPRELTQWDYNPESSALELKLAWLPAELEDQFDEYWIFWGNLEEPYAKLPVGQTSYSLTLETDDYYKTGGTSVRFVPGRKGEKFDVQGYFEQDFILTLPLFDNRIASPEGGWKFKVDKSIKGYVHDEDAEQGKFSFALPRDTRHLYTYYWLDVTRKRVAQFGTASTVKESDPISIVKLPAGSVIPEGAIFLEVSSHNYSNQESNMEIYAVRDLVGNSPTFKDVHPAALEAQAITNLASLDVINGFDDGTFRGEETLTRAQFATLLQRAFRLQSIHNTKISLYSDVPRGQWYTEATTLAGYYDFLKGDGDGTFRPHDTISRTELAVVLARVLYYADPDYTGDTNDITLHFADAKAIPNWAVDSVAMLVKAGMLPNSGSFVGDTEVTRAECAYMLEQLMRIFQLIDSE